MDPARDKAEFVRAADAARDAICNKCLLQPRVGIILGSGLGPLAAEVEHGTVIDYRDIPGFPRTHADGHAGRLVLGHLAGLPVAMLQGRSHRYEGFSRRDVAFPVHVLRGLGVSTLITTNAAGGLNTRFQTGDLMVIDGHIDFLWARGQPDLLAQPGGAYRGPQPYDWPLILRAHQIARRHDIRLHQGCYLATLGPTYETRSEYRMFRRLGADAVGMSTVPEVLAAQALGMNTLGFSVITNVASTDLPTSTSHAEVVDSGKLAGPQLMKIIRTLLEDLAGQPD